jgi:hypothetical protein
MRSWKCDKCDHIFPIGDLDRDCAMGFNIRNCGPITSFKTPDLAQRMKESLKKIDVRILRM